jgi:hypothetical protein
MDKTPGRGSGAQDVTQVQGDASLGATITPAGCCLQPIVPGAPVPGAGIGRKGL